MDDDDDAFSFCDIQPPKCKVLNLRLVPRLLRLPRELRDLIYQYALIEPPRWQKLHKASCVWNPDPEGLKYPLPHSILMRHAYTHDELKRGKKPPCTCGKRSALNLRRACRQIYAETTPVFYERNVFSFADAKDLSQWIRRLTPHKRSLVRHLHALRDPTRGLGPYRDVELLPGLRTLDIDTHFLAKDFGGRRADARCANLAQLTQLRRVRVIRPAFHPFELAPGVCYARIPVWEVRHAVLSAADWWREEYDRQGRVDSDHSSLLTAATEGFLEEHAIPASAAPSEWAAGPLRVPMFDREDFGEILCFNVPLAQSVVEGLRRKERKAVLKAEAEERKGIHDTRLAEIEAKARVVRLGKLAELAEKKEQQRQEEVARLQPHKKWHVEVRSRRAGIARGKGRAEKLHLEDEMEWARGDWEACGQDADEY